MKVSDRGKGRKAKENGDRLPANANFGFKVALCSSIT